MTRFLTIIFLCVFSVSFITHADDDAQKFDKIASKSILKEGLLNYYWSSNEGKVYLEVNNFGEEFLYASFLAAGVGSNDIGLDRGQIGASKVVRFERYGPRVLLIQTNYDFRAESENPDEQRSVREAFAESVLGGFKVEAESEGRVLIDLTDFIIRDEHGVINSLKRRGQGSYQLDKSKSAIYHDNLKNFPQNSDFEAILTFKGIPEGRYVREVVPSPQLVTVRQRHSFVALPDDNYEKRIFDSRGGFFGMHYLDYAAPIHEDIHKHFISRHRLKKKNPKRKISEPQEPIIYYVDRGAPEPIRSALIEGASWWNEAFEAAGFKDAFRVEVLPEDADPLDVRYNVIQWVHRSTRGWSYGGSIRDPRTGEIIKGHVSLGSLRVRQDYLIAQGLLAPFDDGKQGSGEMAEMALARLKQLSAHEVGHTIGLAHNYIASTYNRGSVMDYPHPLIQLNEEGKIDLSDAYDVGIGNWDKVAIKFGYSEFNDKQDETAELNDILQRGIEEGIIFLSDQDARPAGSAHPKAHLWDNGADASDELMKILTIRDKALSNFSEKSIPVGTPMSAMEEVLVPIYFLHRYQTEAAVKVIGGLEYNYAIRGDGIQPTYMISRELQMKSLEAVLATLDPQRLALHEKLIALIPPKPLGYSRGRENVRGHTGLTFDPLAFAETSATMTIQLLLNTQRCARLVEHHLRDKDQPALNTVLSQTFSRLFEQSYDSEMYRSIQYLVQDIFIDALIALTTDVNTTILVRSESRSFLYKMLEAKSGSLDDFFAEKIAKFLDEPITIKPSKALTPPDGSPIGIAEWNLQEFNHQCASFH